MLVQRHVADKLIAINGHLSILFYWKLFAGSRSNLPSDVGQVLFHTVNRNVQFVILVVESVVVPKRLLSLRHYTINVYTVQYFRIVR